MLGQGFFFTWLAGSSAQAEQFHFGPLPDKRRFKEKVEVSIFVKRGIIYSTQVLDLVNEDEGLPAKSSHAQCLTLWQLSSNPRQERRYLMMVDIAVSSKREETERRFNAIIFLPGKGWWPSCLCFAQPT